MEQNSTDCFCYVQNLRNYNYSIMNENHPLYFDFEELKNYEDWYFKASDAITFLDDAMALSDAFQKRFPILSEVIRRARVLNLLINNQKHRLYSWTIGGKSYGWLCIFEDVAERGTALLAEHQLLLNEMGGIAAVNNREDWHFSDGQKFLFTGSECSKGIAGWENFYDMVCEDCEISESDKIEHKDFVVFAQAANGDVTLYNPVTKDVLQFNHDGHYTGLDGEYCTEILPQQPEDTFYMIKGVKDFTDFVEMYAEGWLQLLDSVPVAVKNLLGQKELEEAAQLTETLPDGYGKGELENLIGIEYFYAADYNKALEFYLKAMKNEYRVTTHIDFNIWEVCELLMKEDNDKVKWPQFYLDLFPNGSHVKNARRHL